VTIPNSLERLSIAIDSLKPHGRQIRRHRRSKIEKLKKLIAHYGQLPPIIVDTSGAIIDGHAVWQAMRELGAAEIGAIRVAGRSEAEIRALRLALNRLPAEAAWDNKELRAEFEELISLSFDLDLTGFDTAEIDHVLDLDLPTANVVEDSAGIPPLDHVPVSAAGDIWICGDHRLGCGDALDQTFVELVRERKLVDVVFADPPFNLKIDGFASHRHPDFVQGAGEMSSNEFTTFLAKALTVLQQSCGSRALIYICMDWRHLFELLTAGRDGGLPLSQLCVWAKTNPGLGGLYRSQHELVCVFRAGPDAPVDNVALGRHGRNRSNLWTYRGQSAFGADRDESLAAHPTVKPVALVADVLRDTTKRRGIVLDTFAGSGTTIIAAQDTGRRCYSVELDPRYVDVAVRRFQHHTGRDAIHAETGELFNERYDRLLAITQEPHADGK